MEKIKAAKTAQLVEMFELTEKQEMTPEMAIVRGWIMDELEARDPEAFDKWIDSLEDSPRKFYC